jgi:type VI protein secretion system component VasK
MKVFLLWTVLELTVVAVASRLWGFHDVYQWRTHNPWVAAPLFVIAVFLLWRKHGRKSSSPQP